MTWFSLYWANAKEIDEHKRTMLLADKAGLLPLDIRLVPSPCDLVLIVRYLNCLRTDIIMLQYFKPHGILHVSGQLN
jgi:hypothetical protein